MRLQESLLAAGSDVVDESEGNRYQAFRNKYEVSGGRQQVAGSRKQVSGIRRQVEVSGTRKQETGSMHEDTGDRPQAPARTQKTGIVAGGGHEERAP